MDKIYLILLWSSFGAERRTGHFYGIFQAGLRLGNWAVAAAGVIFLSTESRPIHGKPLKCGCNQSANIAKSKQTNEINDFRLDPGEAEQEEEGEKSFQAVPVPPPSNLFLACFQVALTSREFSSGQSDPIGASDENKQVWKREREREIKGHWDRHKLGPVHPRCRKMREPVPPSRMPVTGQQIKLVVELWRLEVRRRSGQYPADAMTR